MIYYDDGIILIRTLVPDDAQILAEEEQLQGDHVTREKYDMRLQDQAEGKAVALAAEYQGQTAVISASTRILTGAPLQEKGCRNWLILVS